MVKRALLLGCLLTLTAAASQQQVPNGPRHLVYTTIGGTSYMSCLRILLHSLSHFNRAGDFTFLIITDSTTRNALTFPTTCLSFPVEFLVLNPKEVDRPGEQPDVAASARKLNLHRWPRINEFDRILFLDADYLAVMDVSTLLNLKIEPGILYAFNEQKFLIEMGPEGIYDLHKYKHGYWSLKNYTDADIAMFRANKILPFSAGGFLFKNTPEMKQHFQNIKSEMMTYKGFYFYEQSFMNVYFNLRRISNTSVLSPYQLEHWHIKQAAGTYAVHGKVIHFAGSGDGETRGHLMQQFYHEEILQQLTQKVSMVSPFLETLSMYALEALPADRRAGYFMNMGHIGQVPREIRRYFELASRPGVKTICEIGFNAGHSSAVFLTSNPTATLYSFDLMMLPYSNRCMGLFRTLFPQNFHFIKGSSFDGLPWLHKYNTSLQCDLFSVDGDHGYEGALTDYLNAWAMMPPGAIMVADDTSDRFSGCKRAWEDMAAGGYITNVHCEAPESGDANAATADDKRWCWGTTAANPKGKPPRWPFHWATPKLLTVPYSPNPDSLFQLDVA